MNASAQSLSISIVSKIANVSTIFQTQFPSALVDFSPWVLDEKEQYHFDPNSIDIAFSFPKDQPHLACACMLLQVYFSGDLQLPTRKLGKIKLTGHDASGQHWRFSSLGEWQFSGMYLPSEAGQQQILSVVSQLHMLFGYSKTISR